MATLFSVSKPRLYVQFFTREGNAIQKITVCSMSFDCNTTASKNCREIENSEYSDNFPIGKFSRVKNCPCSRSLSMLGLEAFLGL